MVEPIVETVPELINAADMVMESASENLQQNDATMTSETTQ